MSKTVILSALATVTLAALLAGCSIAPLRVGLPDAQIDLTAAGNTSGQVIYPAQGSQFERTVIDVKTISVDGTASITGLSSDVSLTFYGRVTDPASDTACSPVGTPTPLFYVCDANTETAVSSQIDLTLAAPSQDVTFSGTALVEGINQGSIWLGVEGAGQGAASGTLTLSNLVASVTVF